MSREEHNKVGYVVALVSEFATKFGVMPKQAYGYLKRFKGLDYLYKHYDTLHTFSFEESLSVLSDVCRNNGGRLQYHFKD